MIFITNYFRKKKFKFFFLPLIATIFFACESEELELDGPEQDRQATEVDTFSITGQTVEESNLSALNFSIDRVGEVNDPVFGNTKAHVSFDFDLPAEWEGFYDDAELQDVYLTINIANGETPPFGDREEPMKFTLHRLAESLQPDTDYRSDASIDFEETPLAEYSGTIDEEQSMLRLDIDDALGEELIGYDPEIFSGRGLFTDNFEGFALRAEKDGETGAIFYFALENPETSLTVVTDQDSVDFPVNDNSTRVNLFEHDRENTPVQEQLDDEGDRFDKIYAQPMASVKGNIRFPYLRELANTQYNVVHRAELTLPAETPADSAKFPLATRLLIFDATEDFENRDVLDFVGGELGSNGSYTFEITRYMQRLLKNYREDEGYTDFGLNILVPSDNPPLANRVILPVHNDQEMELKIWLSGSSE